MNPAGNASRYYYWVLAETSSAREALPDVFGAAFKKTSSLFEFPVKKTQSMAPTESMAPCLLLTIVEVRNSE